MAAGAASPSRSRVTDRLVRLIVDLFADVEARDATRRGAADNREFDVLSARNNFAVFANEF